MKGIGGRHGEKRYRRPRISAVMVVLALGLSGSAGCARVGGDDVATAGGAAKTAAASDGPSPAADAEERMWQFTRCMREHGIDMPDPEPGGRPVIKLTGGADKEKVDKAREACKKYLPGAAGDRLDDPEFQESLRQYAKCMREHGVDMPDPAPGSGVQIDKRKMQDPTYKKAHEACADRIKRKGPGPSRTGAAK